MMIQCPFCLSSLALFYSIETEFGHRLSLTGSHFIAVHDHQQPGEPSYVPAHQIKRNDIVLINDHGQIRSVAVRNVTEEFRVGYFTPMTSQGDIIFIDNSFLTII